MSNRGEPYDEFEVKPSPRTIEKEIENLLTTDEATRADMAIALRKLEKEIAERRRIEEEILNLSSRQKAILATVPDIITEVNNDKIYTWANRAGFEFFGEDLIGKEAAYYFEGKQDTYNVVQPLFDGDENLIYVESWQRRRDGQKRLLAWWCRVLKDAEGKTAGALSSAHDITERRQAEKSLRKSEEKYRHLVENVNEAIFVAQDEKLVFVNPMMTTMFGYSIEEFMARPFIEFIHQDDRELVLTRHVKRLKGEKLPNRYSFRVIHQNGIPHWVELNTILIEWEGRSATLNMMIDITESKRAEEEKERLQAQLLQAQKMESIGRLAGGLAHDFNNMLGIILGSAELALLQSDPDEPVHQNLQQIFNAAKRSADLVRQLLAFARKQTISPRVLDLNDTVSGMLKMLRRLIGEDIDLAWMPGHALWPVKMDPSQIDQILANLTVNARDAISGVGKIMIKTGNIVFDKTYCADKPGFLPGEYVLLSVSDNGAGMGKEILENLFEPFFTTKEVGKGTGLGLATIYGIVKQNEGFINVHSAPGEGATFTIYLPRFNSEVIGIPQDVQEETAPGGKETVLVVEDEEGILYTARGMLEVLGYQVLTARTVSQAISIAEGRPEDIHLLITDVVMPEMNGRALAERLTSIRPGMKTLFMSGYTADVIAHRDILEDGLSFIQKPFSLKGLAAKVREVLD